MLTILGQQHRFCDRVSRRNFLRIGGLALGGLSLPQLLRARHLHQAAELVFAENLDLDVATGVQLFDPLQLVGLLARDAGRRLAVDRGVPLPNVNDGFAGRAPDLGALETGRPLPHYGPRP